MNYSHENQKPGWHCTRESNHDGPCALVPASSSYEDKILVRRQLVDLYESSLEIYKRALELAIEPAHDYGPENTVQYWLNKAIEDLEK